jgi:AcrR family transcriptional regulator
MAGTSARPAGPASPPAAPATARRGRPRSEAADQAILRAATGLLAERGLPGMSIEEVAARAGVGKATVYRRWPSRGVLALDSFLADFGGLQRLADTGSLRGDLRGALRGWVHAVTQTPAGPMLASLIAEAQRDPALAAAWRARVLEPIRERHRGMLERAVARGDLPADVDYDVLLDLLFGPAAHRLLHGHQPLTERFADEVADLLAAGALAAPPRRPAS